MPSPLRSTLFAALFVFAAGPLAAQPSPERSAAVLTESIDAVLADSLFENAFWAVLVRDLDSGETLYARNEDKSFMPASNAKLYTTAAALDLLGPAFTYETHVFAGGPIVDGVLRGPLIIQGSGDPSLGTFYDPATGERTDSTDVTAVFRSWADALRRAGITAIAGDLVGDDDVFDDVPLGVGWSWDDEPYWYSAELNGLVFADNNVAVRAIGTAPGSPARLVRTPDLAYLSVVNHTRSVPADSARDLSFHRLRAQNVLTIGGDMPATEEDVTFLSVSNPTLYFLDALRQTLLNAGIAVQGRTVDVDDLSIKPAYETLRPVAHYTSPPLRDIARVVNKPSQNLYADQLLKTLGVERPTDDPEIAPGSAEMGLEAAMTTFARTGMDTSRFSLVDGSGLSRMNFITAEMTMALLDYMWRHPDAEVREAFLASLPVGGQDGTLENRFKNPDLMGRVRAKTGTLTGASSLSGYLTTDGGTPLGFVLMSNGHTVSSSEARRLQDAVVALLASYPR